MRCGIGYDIHPLIHTLERSSIPVGGVSITCQYRVQAHSDGDVLLHALVDACLGALALGDIGEWFPETEENVNRSSQEMVRNVVGHIHKMGWRIVQADSNIFLEEPRLKPHTDSIRREMAQLLQTELSSVSVKAKTMEGMGPVGESRAIAAQVIVLLEEAKSALQN